MLEFGEIGKHLRSMPCDVMHGVGATNQSVGADEVAVAFRIVAVPVLRWTYDLVLLADRSVDIAEQSEREILGLGEGPILLDGVE